jgi:hypothetical protein
MSSSVDGRMDRMVSWNNGVKSNLPSSAGPNLVVLKTSYVRFIEDMIVSQQAKP